MLSASLATPQSPPRGKSNCSSLGDETTRDLFFDASQRSPTSTLGIEVVVRSALYENGGGLPSSLLLMCDQDDLSFSDDENDDVIAMAASPPEENEELIGLRFLDDPQQQTLASVVVKENSKTLENPFWESVKEATEGIERLLSWSRYDLSVSS